MSTKRVALYIRVSTEEQAREGYSLTTQREFLEQYAKQQGWAVYHPKPGAIYEDDGFSGGTLNRPALQRLLADAKLKKFDLVLVYKLDRFTRKLQDLENITEDLQVLGIGFKSATEEFDTSTSTGKLQCQLLGVFAEFERKRIAERIFPGMVRCIQEGYWHGARYAPYGYRYDKKERQLQIIPAEAELVKLMYAMYLEGQSTRQIAGYCYRKGYKTRSGGLFHTHLVGTILKNQVYIGKLAWNKKHYDKQQKTPGGKPRYVKNPIEVHVVAQGRHQAIISEEEFRQVQERLAMQRKNRVVRAHAREYPLSGIIICGKCEHRYLGTLAVATRKTGEKRRYYRCSAPSTHDIPCKNAAVRADVLEAQVFRLLDLMMEHESAKNGRLESLIQAEATFQDATLDQQHKDIKGRLKGNLEKQGKLVDAYTEGTLAKKVYVERAELLREQEADIRRELSKVELELVERERSEQYQHLLAAVVSSTDWETTKIDIFRKRQLLKLLFKRIVVTNGEITDTQFYKPFQRMYDEVISRRKTSTKHELEEVCKGVCIWRPTAVR